MFPTFKPQLLNTARINLKIEDMIMENTLQQSMHLFSYNYLTKASLRHKQPIRHNNLKKVKFIAQ